MFKSRAAQRQLLLLNYGHSADGVPPPIWRAASRQRPPARTLPPNSPPATTSANSLRPCSTATQNLNAASNKTPFSSPIMNAKKIAHNLRCPRLDRGSPAPSAPRRPHLASASMATCGLRRTSPAFATRGPPSNPNSSRGLKNPTSSFVPPPTPRRSQPPSDEPDDERDHHLFRLQLRADHPRRRAPPQRDRC